MMTEKELKQREERVQSLITTCPYKAFAEAFREYLDFIKEYRELKAKYEMLRKVLQ